MNKHIYLEILKKKYPIKEYKGKIYICYYSIWGERYLKYWDNGWRFIVNG